MDDSRGEGDNEFPYLVFASMLEPEDIRILLDLDNCRCMDYKARARQIADCLVLKVEEPETFGWLPGTCAYRLLADGEELPEWHPLITGDRESVHEAGISAKGKVVSERETTEYRVLWKL